MGDFINCELIQLTKVAAVKSLLRSPGCCASNQQRTTAAREEGPTHVIHVSIPLAATEAFHHAKQFGAAKEMLLDRGSRYWAIKKYSL